MGENFRRTGRDRAKFGTSGQEGVLEVQIETPGITTDDIALEEKLVTRSRRAGRIHRINLQLATSLVQVADDYKLGGAENPRDVWQPDGQLAGFIQRIQEGPGDGRTGWPSPTHCAHHL